MCEHRNGSGAFKRFLRGQPTVCRHSPITLVREFQPHSLSQDSQVSQNSQGPHVSGRYAQAARVRDSAAQTTASRCPKRAVKWFVNISIRVTGPIAKRESLRARKGARSGGLEAARRFAFCGGTMPLTDVGTKQITVGDNRGRLFFAVQKTICRQPPCPILKIVGKNEIFSSGCKVKTLPRGAGASSPRIKTSPTLLQV